MLAPGKRVPVRHQRAVPTGARQAAINAPVPAYNRAVVALGGELMDGQLPLPAAGSDPIVISCTAVAARCLADKPPLKQRKIDTARTGRYYSQPGAVMTRGEVGAELRASTEGAIPQEAAWADTNADLSAAVAAALAENTTAGAADGSAFAAATIALRQAISVGGAAALSCWHSLLLLSSRRARLTGSPG